MPPNTCCPALHEEEWRRIACYLCPRDLSALSQVSTTCFFAATSPEVFRRRYLEASRGEVPPFAVSDSISWATLYRRRCALRYPPDVHETFALVHAPVEIVVTVGDTVVFHEKSRSSLVGFPAEWTVDLLPLCVNVEKVRESCIVLRHGHFAFVGVQSPGEGDDPESPLKVWLTVIHAKTGNIVAKTELPSGSDPLCFPVKDSKFAMLGGRDGDYIVYFVDYDTMAVISLSDFAVASSQYMLCLGDDALVSCESSSLGVPTICGKAVMQPSNGRLNVQVKNLLTDVHIASFTCEYTGIVEDVESSLDGSTYVLSAIGGDIAFVRSCTEPDIGFRDWDFDFPNDGLGFTVKGNGRLVAPTPRPELLGPRSEVQGFMRHCRYFFLEPNGETKAVELQDGDEDEEGINHVVVWQRMSEHGGLSLMQRLRHEGSSALSLWEIEFNTLATGFRVCNRRRLALWDDFHFVDFAFVGDHVLIGVLENQTVVTLHFGAYCTAGAKASKFTLGECVFPLPDD